MTTKLPIVRWLRTIVIAIMSVGAMGAPICAQETGTFEFMGVEVKHHTQDYIVTTDANVRAKPLTKSKKVGKLKKRQRVKVIGKAPGAWVAIRLDGKDLGFVYEPILIGVLDGTLEEPLVGTVKKTGHPDCQYTITYQGKSEAEGQLFEIADYEVHWRCQRDGTVGEFSTPMFMTEGPYKKSKKPSYQVTVDIVDPEGDLDEVISTTVFYDRNNSTISFDGVSEKRFAGKPDVLEVFVRSLPSALRAGVEMSYQAWSEPLWKVLLGTGSQ